MDVWSWKSEERNPSWVWIAHHLEIKVCMVTLTLPHYGMKLGRVGKLWSRGRLHCLYLNCETNPKGVCLGKLYENVIMLFVNLIMCSNYTKQEWGRYLDQWIVFVGVDINQRCINHSSWLWSVLLLIEISTGHHSNSWFVSCNWESECFDCL